jgi:hypothetical protein
VCLVKLRKWHYLVIEGVVALVVLAACTAIVVRTVSRGDAPAPASPYTVSLPVDGHSTATLQVLSGTPMLKISMANLGRSGALLKVTSAAGSTMPQLVSTSGSGAAADAVVSLSVKNAASVTVVLNAAVRWQLDLAGGTTQTIADLRGGQVSGIAVTKGSGVISLTMPKPRASVLIKLAAGASKLLLSLPSGAQARITAKVGAGAVSLNGVTHKGVIAGSVFTTPGWTSGAAGFDIDAIAGASHITVTTMAT